MARKWCRARSIPALAIAATAGAWAGCEGTGPLDRQPVAGSVTLDGLALPSGAILFEPASEAEATAVGATIHEGAFSIGRREGPVPGRYRVSIYASSAVQAAAPPGSSARKPRPMVELLPETYNSRTKLGATIRRGGTPPLRFDLRSDGSIRLDAPSTTGDPP